MDKQQDTKVKIKVPSSTAMAVSIAFLGIAMLAAAGAGNYYRRVTSPVKIKEIAPLTEGCILSIIDRSNSKINIILAKSELDCESLFIAEKFNGRIDFSRLLVSLGYIGLFEKELILDITNDLSISFLFKDGISGNYVYNYFGDIESKFLFNKCHEIKYFGATLFCFNGVVDKKLNNLNYIIPYFTVLKYTSNIEVSNQLIGDKIKPYELVADGFKFFDASKPELYGQSLESTKCTADKGGANYQVENEIYICDKMLKPISPYGRIHYAAILYHEVNHKFQIDGHSYQHTEDLLDVSTEELEKMDIKSSCKKINTYHPRRRDWDFKSVYGAHIEYLLSMSQNGILSCYERVLAFDLAEKEMKLKLCQYPNKPYLNTPEPSCN
ncbi:hypothetical protein KJ785_00780 [Patescibacteria group bacterium]|nr:hypothetical protein [Patescibacteria group bacterium]